MGPKTTFFAWLFGTVAIATFGVPREHGNGLIMAVVIFCVGTIGGLIHAIIVYRREHITTSIPRHGDV
jgi:hypothetical protein